MEALQALDQPVKAFDLRTAMPLTAEWIDGRRIAWGKKYVNDMLRRAQAGERGCFYAIEAGHIWGQPFDWSPKIVGAISMGVMSGAKYLAAMRDPKTLECLVAARDAAPSEKA